MRIISAQELHVHYADHPRIDAPGALHHIICRGIERRRIFEDDQDRRSFIKRLGGIMSETETPCYAWALIPNHFHILARTGDAPLSTVMRRLLTGYAVSFNRRHRRSGHLFQNRYKSILCQEDACPNDLIKIEPAICGRGVADTDSDGNGKSDCIDNCLNVFNLDQKDFDRDSVGDLCNNCIEFSNRDQADEDGDGIGDECEPLNLKKSII